MAGFSHIFSDRHVADQTAGCHYGAAAGVDVGPGCSPQCRADTDTDRNQSHRCEAGQPPAAPPVLFLLIRDISDLLGNLLYRHDKQSELIFEL